jgi:hypothetical protein
LLGGCLGVCRFCQKILDIFQQVLGEASFDARQRELGVSDVLKSIPGVTRWLQKQFDAEETAVAENSSTLPLLFSKRN